MSNLVPRMQHAFRHYDWTAKRAGHPCPVHREELDQISEGDYDLFDEIFVCRLYNIDLDTLTSWTSQIMQILDRHVPNDLEHPDYLTNHLGLVIDRAIEQIPRLSVIKQATGQDGKPADWTDDDGRSYPGFTGYEFYKLLERWFKSLYVYTIAEPIWTPIESTAMYDYDAAVAALGPPKPSLYANDGTAQQQWDYREARISKALQREKIMFDRRVHRASKTSEPTCASPLHITSYGEHKKLILQGDWMGIPRARPGGGQPLPSAST